MLRFAFLTAFVVLASGGASIRINTPDGTEVLHTDNPMVTQNDLDTWAQFSDKVVPYNFLLVPESLGLCLEGVPGYRRCGSRDLNDPNFMYNAAENIRRIRARILALRTTSFPSELQPNVVYLVRLQTAILTLELAQLKFLQDGNMSDLQVSVEGIDIGDKCPCASALANARGRAEVYRLVTTEWASCANRKVMGVLGDYPTEPWSNLLRHYEIREEFIERDVSESAHSNPVLAWSGAIAGRPPMGRLESADPVIQSEAKKALQHFREPAQ